MLGKGGEEMEGKGAGSVGSKDVIFPFSNLSSAFLPVEGALTTRGYVMSALRIQRGPQT